MPMKRCSAREFTPRHWHRRFAASARAAFHSAIVEVLTEAIVAGGLPFPTMWMRRAARAFSSSVHRVYQRTGEPCVTCGAKVRRVLVAQRSSHFARSAKKR